MTELLGVTPTQRVKTGSIGLGPSQPASSRKSALPELRPQGRGASSGCFPSGASGASIRRPGSVSSEESNCGETARRYRPRTAPWPSTPSSASSRSARRQCRSARRQPARSCTPGRHGPRGHAPLLPSDRRGTHDRASRAARRSRLDPSRRQPTARCRRARQRCSRSRPEQPGIRSRMLQPRRTAQASCREPYSAGGFFGVVGFFAAAGLSSGRRFSSLAIRFSSSSTRFSSTSRPRSFFCVSSSLAQL